ncbi:flagellar biosynthesis protein FlhA [Legionella quateirensis]|uniref:Flagellar biosynthesis protein FlhA n=1 Tax=Legionella quateirensis TaxID=45072 RepID=A0A378KVA3_9GAMM|nr:flagellar biosynthesis protein FlhA [Legionella quateirensis]KTD51306.1 flagellar biosynthesis protein FlhA [Legionella quateirensis]STY17447.1 flagellar biosynthesis protein FlhA [Legionella quateirensis]
MISKSHFLNNSSELIMIAFATGILFILFIPIPSGLLDLLLIVNFSWALTILLLTFYTDKPLSFSTFPALLLISTLFRLALNISATRLILSDGDAGKVIQAMGHYVIHGNYVMGLVVFLILIIVQFIVVTNGAQRVAEVAARFTLDSMPGKQMSIDADLNMGSISQSDAKARRSQIEKEANFYGAMDGASKFVKGDAIAGILIILVDIIGGFAIGLIQKGFSLSESIQTYTLLTVGDGLVTQIPALIISTATGIIVTRAATDAQLGSEVAKQISSYPKSLIMVCCSLVGLLFVKGIPAVPVLFILSLFAGSTWFAIKAKKKEDIVETEENLYEKIRIHPVEINLNKELYSQLIPYENHLLESIQIIRERIAFDLGFVLPEVKIKTDKKLGFPFYSICIQGNNDGTNPLHLDKALAIVSTRSKNTLLPAGIEVRDPSYGLPAIWIEHQNKQDALDNGFTVCEPLMVLTTHLNETIQSHIAELLTREETEHLLLQPGVKVLSDELIPSLLPLGHVQRILQNLLKEKVSIRYLTQILELLLEHAKKIPDPIQLTEMVRSGLAVPICQKLLVNQDSLHVLTLEATLEQKLNQNILNKEFFSLEPGLTERLITSLANQVEHMLGERKRPILLCSSQLRRHLKQLTQRVIPHLTVLAMNEIPVNVQVESFGVVK